MERKLSNVKTKNNLCGAVSLDRISLPGRLPFSRFGASPEMRARLRLW